MTTKMTIHAPRMKTRTSRLRAGARLLCIFALVAAMNTAAASGMWAPGSASETTKVPKLRTVEGMVCSNDGKPVQGAVVYLQDSKSLAVKSYLSDAQGKFHFRELSMSADYDLWAEMNGKRSKTKSISQFNSKPDLQYRLKVKVAE
ncbi:MAG TPA: carboxypeptidase-like regulatory domain-containing protein [Acidobacteriaceae bacterium]|nr:carboxypeptidase-like regulatory domain-containing protein [Acidobacteriaceae bacterium]